jgi:oligopeptide/dipeptide ABC transporter ATP-binding protein
MSTLAMPSDGTGAAPVLAVEDLHVDIALRHSTVHAVDGISFELAPGERLGLVGESGCGKSTLGLALAGLLPSSAKVSGSIRLGGKELVGAGERELRRVRGRDVGVVFQDPMTSLNPTKRIGVQVGEALRLHDGATAAEARARAREMLDLVGLPRPGEQLDRYPHELSGGMRQRVVIACALICHPTLLVADEPTTALDVTIQSQILDLFDRLRDELGMAILLVTHDMGVVAGHTDRILVMYGGREAELGPTSEVFAHPRHRYSAGLLASVIRVGTPRGSALSSIGGRPPDLAAQLPSCSFAARCGYADASCRDVTPPVRADGAHRWRCHHPATSADAVPAVQDVSSVVVEP